MEVRYILRSDLVIRSKRDALEFLDGIKSVILIPLEPATAENRMYLRVEPGKKVSRIWQDDIDTGRAPFIPFLYDWDGGIVWRYRKAVNTWLWAEFLED